MDKILSKLVSFPTVSKNFTANEQALDWLKEQICELPVFISCHKSNGFSSLMITTKKTKKPQVLLAAHLDVVPAPAKMFKPVIKNNKMYGRGVYDMKFAIACYLRLLQELKTVLADYNFGIMITTDEEIGGFNGVDKLLKLGYGADVCLLPDSGKAWVLENEAKGVWHLRIESYGKSAHGSVPWLGENAIEALIDYLNVLRDKFFCQGKFCRLPNHYHETLNIGRIEGGEVANKVPDFASCLIDIRFTPSLSRAKINNILQTASKKFKNIQIKDLVFADAYKLDPNNQYCQLFRQIAKSKLRKDIPIDFSHGSTDARFFMFKKIPTLVISPLGGGHHSDQEWVDLKDLEKFYSVLKEFINQTAKIKK